MRWFIKKYVSLVFGLVPPQLYNYIILLRFNDFMIYGNFNKRRYFFNRVTNVYHYKQGSILRFCKFSMSIIARKQDCFYVLYFYLFNIFLDIEKSFEIIKSNAHR